jgi:pimeloyl-ACP methyl ester carboxylesterase
MTGAAVVLVHGPCGTPAVWSRVIRHLDDLGVPSLAVHLPSSLPESELADAAFLRSVLDEGDGPMVLVGHSSGGLVITEVGEHPFVKHLVFLDGSTVDADKYTFALLTYQIYLKFTLF